MTDLQLHGSVSLVNRLDLPARVLPEHDLVNISLKMTLAELVINAQLRSLQ
ncbi:hypothetical protein [Labrenzia sp. OB1]|uniref:hypothetical protein n=1 Tax=Labrenzia sp. OB1 TaxID=1561204 RepID=UPI001FCB07CF|nr:hypothetical protein [Labrenzia sp. OB1]